jgi:hypothetical protein
VLVEGAQPSLTIARDHHFGISPLQLEAYEKGIEDKLVVVHH